MQPIKDKNFLNFFGKPLIWHQIQILKSAGFKDFVIVGGAHNLSELGKVAKNAGVKAKIVEQKDLDLGMCGAVLAAEKFVKKEPALVMSGNDFVEKSAFEMVKKAAIKNEAESFIVAKKVAEYFPGGYLKVDKNGFIKGIVEKPGAGKEPSDLVNLVIHLHKNFEALCAELKKTKSGKDDLYETALDNLIKKGLKMKALKYGGFWQPIKYPWHVQAIFRYLFSIQKKKKGTNVKIAKSAKIDKNVIFGKDVKVMDNAVIVGPTFIGDGSVVATNALVRESHIGENCVIGFSTEVARSFLGRDVWTHSNYIGDSIIGDNVSFGGGTVTGNLRLDEANIADSGVNKLGAIIGDNVRVGINTSLMPGIKIGENSLVGAGIILAENVEANSFVRGEVKLKISPNKFDVGSLSRNKMRKKL